MPRHLPGVCRIHNKTMKTKHGFTIIELAIVLTIVASLIVLAAYGIKA